MNLAQVKRLKVGDKFRCPSTRYINEFGWRVYTVIKIDKSIACEDQRGYIFRIYLSIWNSSYGDKNFMKLAERIIS